MKPGDDCPKCSGHIIVRDGQRQGASLVRYLRCWKCGETVGREIVPVSSIRKRRRRKPS